MNHEPVIMSFTKTSTGFHRDEVLKRPEQNAGWSVKLRFDQLYQGDINREQIQTDKQVDGRQIKEMLDRQIGKQMEVRSTGRRQIIEIADRQMTDSR